MKRTLFAMVLMILWTGQAFAQDTPYSALTPSVKTMVTKGTFDKSPLKLPFAQAQVESVTSGATINFKHTLNENYDKVLSYFQDKKQRKLGYDIIDRKMYSMLPAGTKLRVFGSRILKAGGMEFQLGHPKISRRFRIRVMRNGSNAEVIFLNTVLTSLTSGVGPARAPFTPVGTEKTVPFRWN